MLIAIAALLGLVAGYYATHILNRKKKRYETEDIEALGRMHFLDGFNEGWDKALATVEKITTDCENISKKEPGV